VVVEQQIQVHDVSANPNIQEVVGKVTTTNYEAVDCTDNRFFISGSLSGGIVKLTVVAELPDGTRGAVRGGEFFQTMIDHFGLANIKSIEGEWTTGDPDLATNINAFNKATAAGDTDKVAATKTATGRLAARVGLTEVVYIRALPAKAAGRYTDVLARFARPQAGP